MSGETIITVVGNLTGPVDLKFTPSGAAVAGFTIASTARVFDKKSNEWKDGEPLFLRCTAWRQMAENAAESLEKGTRVIVHGRLHQRSYEGRDGSRQTSTELEIEEIGPSLKFATAKAVKAGRRVETSTAAPSTGGDPWGTAPF